VSAEGKDTRCVVLALCLIGSATPAAVTDPIAVTQVLTLTGSFRTPLIPLNPSGRTGEGTLGPQPKANARASGLPWHLRLAESSLYAFAQAVMTVMSLYVQRALAASQ
jgi:hypothetical protein